MKKALIIANKEFNSYLDSIGGYIVMVLFLGITGFFTWLSGNNIFFIGQADLTPFFAVAFWTLFFFVPAITMRSFAEEQNLGTLELLLTHPVSYDQTVMGKFLGAFYLILMTLAFTLIYYLSVALIGPVDHGATVSGYIGLILLSSAYIAIGIYASSLTKNQIVAFLISLGIAIFFQLIFDMIANITHGWISELFRFLSFNTHFQTMARGVIRLDSVLYFFAVIYIALRLAVINLYSRRYN